MLDLAYCTISLWISKDFIDKSEQIQISNYKVKLWEKTNS